MKLEHSMTREEWLDWRVGRVGASECPKLLGVVRDGRFDLWEKLRYNKRDDIYQSDSMRFGNMVEEALVLLAEEFGVDVERQAIYVCDQFDRLHATVDGSFLDPITGEIVIVECKARSNESAHMLSEGEVPVDIFLQCQQQMLCSGANMCVIVWTDRLGDGVSRVNLMADREVHEEILRQAKYMYECVEKLRQPDNFFWRKKMDNIDTNAQIKDLVEKLKRLQPSPEEISRSNALKLVEQSLKELCGMCGGAISCDGVSVKESTRVGSVKYDRIPSLQGVDLNEYRGEPIKTYKISITG